MTRGQIISLATGLIGKTDAATISFANDSLSQRYGDVWDAANWSETLTMFYSTSQGPVIICPPIVARVQAVRFNTDTQLTYGAPGFFFQQDPNVFDRSGSPTMFTRLSSCGVAIQPAGTQLVILPSFSDGGQTIVVHGTYQGNDQYEEISINSFAPIVTTSLWDEIDSLSKPVTIGEITIRNPSAVVLVTLQTWETEKRHQRIMILEQAHTDYNVLVLGKKRCPTLTNDNDAPMIRGADAALLCMVQADLLRRDREYTKAQLKDAEAKAQLKKMIDDETNQEAFTARVTPIAEQNYWQMYGTPYAFPQYTK